MDTLTTARPAPIGHNWQPRNPELRATIEQALRNAAPGEIVTYSYLSEITGAEITSATPALRQALWFLQREERIRFLNKVEVGYERASNRAAYEAGARDLRLGRRAMGRALSKMSCVRTDQLSEPERNLHSQRLTSASVAQRASHGNFVRAAAARIAADNQGPTASEMTRTLLARLRPRKGAAEE